MASDTKALSDAFERATGKLGTFRLCPNRVWAVAGTLLTRLLPTNDPIRYGSHENELQNHEMCTFEFCEYSQRDFTAVEQRHECRNKDCCLLEGLFSRQLLENAARADESTVWSLDGRSMISRPRPYMAISHVWSDGTGAGKWPDGEVNECLYNFFKRIAIQFQCNGIWWDTLSIPQEKAARTKAIKKIQSNYENARFTLVHDCFLRNWAWDPKTACFAILMSPWFSRGWTALELQKSRKVKVVFKGPYGLVIKDLDEEILAKDDDYGPHMEASRIIRTLRQGITTLDGLLTILGPRYTSWPKDKSIISGLLADVSLSSGSQKDIWQQDIYKRILKKIRIISSGHLFHNSATMSMVSWCPTSLYDMPVSDDAGASLEVTQDLDLIGTWTRIPLAAIEERRFSWRGVHRLIRGQLELHMQDRDTSFLLFEPLSKSGTVSVERAILGKERDAQSNPPCYEFVGAVYLHPALTEADLNGGTDEVCLRLLGDATRSSFKAKGHSDGDTAKMKTDNADEDPSKGKKVSANTDASEEKIDSKVNASDSEKGIQAQSQGNLQKAAPDWQLHDAIWRGDIDKFEKYIGAIEEEDELQQRPLHLAAERGDVRIVQQLLNTIRQTTNDKSTETVRYNAICNLGQTALHRASWGGCVSVVKMLLEHGVDATIEDLNGNTALHLAAEKGFESVVEELIAKSDCTAKNKRGVSPLHYAASSGSEKIVKLLLISLLQGSLEVEVKYDSLQLQDAGKFLLQTLVKSEDLPDQSKLHDVSLSEQDNTLKSLLQNLYEQDKHGWSPLHYAAANGQASIVELFITLGGDINAAEHKGDEVGWTPLHFAAINNHDNIVKLLLKNNAKEVEDRYGWTPWQFAEIAKHSEVAELLSKNGGNNDIASSQLKWTPLHCAAIDERQVVPTLLPEEDVRLTPLNLGVVDEDIVSWAAQRGQRAVLKLLIEGGASVYTNDKDGRTPLSWAAGNGHGAIVKQLFEANTGIEYDSDDSGRTPLSWAAGNGHETVVKLLLIAGAGFNLLDKDGRPPLSWPPRFLSNTEPHGVRDKDSRTPLSWAAGNGHEAVVKQLLEDGSINLADKDDRTPLSWAAGGGHKAVVKQLLEANAHPIEDDYDKDRRTPLSWAAGNGHEAVVKQLLEATGKQRLEALAGIIIYPDDEDLPQLHEAIAQTLYLHDKDGRTPLSWAASNGHEAVISLLLQSGASISQGDESGRTPLSWAAGNGHTAVVKQLLEAVTGIDFVDQGDKDDRTPLSWAAENGHDAIVKQLLKAGANVVYLPNKDDQALISWAARNEHEAFIIQLLEAGTGISSPDKDDRTPISWAAENGHEAIITQLLEATVKQLLKTAASIDLDDEDFAQLRDAITDIISLDDKDNQTPLLWAARNGHGSVIKQLLEAVGDVDLIDLGDKDDRTPLPWASGNGHEAAVKQLLKNGADINLPDKDSRPPLSWAAENGHEVIMKLLQSSSSS